MADHPEAKASQGAERLYLAVPFEERLAARRLGARWDAAARCWYAPAHLSPSLFARWVGPVASDPIADFAAALSEAGLILNGPPQMDGLLHRVPVHGDRRGAKSGAYVGHLDHRPAGFIQNFKSGEVRNWKAASTPSLTAEERTRLLCLIAAERDRRKQAREAIHVETCRLLKDFLARLPLAGRDHPYLSRKGVDAHGLLLNTEGPLAIHGGASIPQSWSGKGDLILPVCDMGGQLISAQSIDAAGRKAFARGGRVGGGCHLIGAPRDAGLLVIAEGYSTAATIHELTGLAAAAALSAGNLEGVAQSFRTANPDLPILIAGDNDHQKPQEHLPNGRPKPNAGREAAEKAAAAAGGIALLPQFVSDDPGTDWNDLAAKGTQAFFEQWQPRFEAAQLRMTQSHLKLLRRRR